MFGDIEIVTSGGVYPAKDRDDVTLADVLRLNRLPANAYQAYVQPQETATDGANLVPIPLTRSVKEATAVGRVVLRCIRNPVYANILPQGRTTLHRVDDAVTAVEHFVFGDELPCEQVIHELSPEGARSLVSSRVSDFMFEHSTDEVIVVGISGGGDSNTLARSLSSFASEAGKRIVAFTLVFEPVWGEPAHERAAQLCREHAIEHHTFEAKDFKPALKLQSELPDIFDDFLLRFGMHTRPFFGTFFISKIARMLCGEHDSREYCLGFNREDVLTEMIFSLMNGQRPHSYPVRHFGECRLLMPLWQVPKRILDACYPRYSLSNYDERLSGDTVQRSLGYHLADEIEDVYPNLGLSLLEGVRKLFTDGWSELRFDADLDVYVSEYAGARELSEAQAFLRTSFAG